MACNTCFHQLVNLFIGMNMSRNQAEVRQREGGNLYESHVMRGRRLFEEESDCSVQNAQNGFWNKISNKICFFTHSTFNAILKFPFIVLCPFNKFALYSFSI